MNKETLSIHYGYDKDKQGTMSVPIYQTTAYEFGSAEQAKNRFALSELGNIYTRLTNPTTEILENRIAAIEGGSSGLVTASGSSAIFYSLINLAHSGDNVIISNNLYGGSVTLITHTLKRFGISARVFNLDNPKEIENLIDANTKAIFFESLSNPQIAVADIESITSIAKKYKIVTICDNTVATPYICNPIKWGVDVVVHSTSKYISGQGSALGGAIVDSSELSVLLKGNERYPQFNEPDSSYHGLIYSQLPFPIFNLRVRIALLRDIGASAAPFNSWLTIQGLETLKIRIQEHSKNALEIAKFLKSHKKVKDVSYPGLSGDKGEKVAKKYFSDIGSSGLISFEVDGDFEFAKNVCNSTDIFSIVVNIGESRSLIVHPASTTHSQLSTEELNEVGIKENLLRLSIGLENPKDLIADLDKALNS